MSNPKLVSAVNGAYFSVTFPNGINGDPEIKMYGLHINAEMDGGFYGAILACSNYLKNHVDKMKAMPQVEYREEDISGKNVFLKGGEVAEI